MLEFLLGILLCICIALVCVIVYLIKKPKEIVKEELTKDEQRKKLEEQSHYDAILNYNSHQAYGGN